MNKLSRSYYMNARHWFDDVNTLLMMHVARYRMLCCLLASFIFLLLILLIILFPMKSTRLVFVHQMQDGYVWVDEHSQRSLSKKPMEIKNDIARYVINRESYHHLTMDIQQRAVCAMSTPDVSHRFLSINQRQVIHQHCPSGQAVSSVAKVDHITLLKGKRQLAQVHFMVNYYDSSGVWLKRVPMVAVVAWVFAHVPQSSLQQLDNWDGFYVNFYQSHEKYV